MLTIRQEQMPALQQAAERNFEDFMVAHLKEFAPALSQVRGEACLRQVIQIGVEKAAHYGLTDPGPVQFFIELMFPLGSSFDTDFQLPWAGEILTDPESMTQAVRSKRLYRRVLAYLDQVAGPHARFTIEALRRVRGITQQEFEAPARNLETNIINGFRAMHPPKCAYVGETVLRTVCRRAVEAAASYGITSALGVRLLAGLMFGFGHGITADPLYPWVSATLTDTLVHDPNDRAHRLFKKTRIYLEWMLPNLIAESARV